MNLHVQKKLISKIVRNMGNIIWPQKSTERVVGIRQPVGMTDLIIDQIAVMLFVAEWERLVIKGCIYPIFGVVFQVVSHLALLQACGAVVAMFQHATAAHLVATVARASTMEQAVLHASQASTTTKIVKRQSTVVSPVFQVHTVLLVPHNANHVAKDSMLQH